MWYYGHAQRARVSLGNAGEFPLHHGFGGEAPGVAKLDEVLGGVNKERNPAPIVRKAVMGLLVLGAGGYNRLLVGDKDVGRRHGYK